MPEVDIYDILDEAKKLKLWLVVMVCLLLFSLYLLDGVRSDIRVLQVQITNLKKADARWESGIKLNKERSQRNETSIERRRPVQPSVE